MVNTQSHNTPKTSSDCSHGWLHSPYSSILDSHISLEMTLSMIVRAFRTKYSHILWQIFGLIAPIHSIIIFFPYCLLKLIALCSFLATIILFVIPNTHSVGISVGEYGGSRVKSVFKNFTAILVFSDTWMGALSRIILIFSSRSFIQSSIYLLRITKNLMNLSESVVLLLITQIHCPFVHRANITTAEPSHLELIIDQFWPFGSHE